MKPIPPFAAFAAALFLLSVRPASADDPQEQPPQPRTETQPYVNTAGSGVPAWTDFSNRLRIDADKLRQNSPYFQAIQGHLQFATDSHVSDQSAYINIPVNGGAATMRYFPPRPDANPPQTEALILVQNGGGEPQVTMLQPSGGGLAAVPQEGTEGRMVELSHGQEGEGLLLDVTDTPAQLPLPLVERVRNGPLMQQAQGATLPDPSNAAWVPSMNLRLREGEQGPGFFTRQQTRDGRPMADSSGRPVMGVYYSDGQGNERWWGQSMPLASRDGRSTDLWMLQGPNGSWHAYTPNGTRLWNQSYSSWDEVNRDISSGRYLGDIRTRAINGEPGRTVVALTYGNDGEPSRVMDVETGQLYRLGAHASAPNVPLYSRTERRAAAVPTPGATQTTAAPRPAGQAPQGSRPQWPQSLTFRQGNSGAGYALEQARDGRYMELAYYDAQGNRQVHGWSTRLQIQGGFGESNRLVYFHGPLQQGQDSSRVPGAIFAWPSQTGSGPQQASLIAGRRDLDVNNVWSRPVVDAEGRPAGSRPLIPVANSHHDARGNWASIERQYADLQGNRYVLDFSAHVGVFRPVPPASPPSQPEPQRPAPAPAPAQAPLPTREQQAVQRSVQALATANEQPYERRSAAVDRALTALAQLPPASRGAAVAQLQTMLGNAELPYRTRADAAFAIAGMPGLSADQRQAAAQAAVRLFQDMGLADISQGWGRSPGVSYWPHDAQPAYTRLMETMGRLGPEVAQMRLRASFDGQTSEMTVKDALLRHAGQGWGGLTWMNAGNRAAAAQALLAMRVSPAEVARAAGPFLSAAAGTDNTDPASRQAMISLMGSLPAVDAADRDRRIGSLQALMTEGTTSDALRVGAVRSMQRLLAAEPSHRPEPVVAALRGLAAESNSNLQVRGAARQALQQLNIPLQPRTEARPPSAPTRTEARPPSAPTQTEVRPPSAQTQTEARPPSTPVQTEARPPTAPPQTSVRPPATPPQTTARPPAAPADWEQALVRDRDPARAEAFLRDRRLQDELRARDPEQFRRLFTAATQARDILDIVSLHNDIGSLREALASRQGMSLASDPGALLEWARQNAPRADLQLLERALWGWPQLTDQQKTWLGENRRVTEESWAAMSFQQRQAMMAQWGTGFYDRAMAMVPRSQADIDRMQGLVDTARGALTHDQRVEARRRMDQARAGVSALAQAETLVASRPGLRAQLDQAKASGSVPDLLRSLGELFDGARVPLPAALQAERPVSAAQTMTDTQRASITRRLGEGFLRELRGTTGGDRLIDFYADPSNPLRIAIRDAGSAMAYYHNGEVTFGQRTIDRFLKTYNGGITVEQLLNNPTAMRHLVWELAPCFVHEGTHHMQDVWVSNNRLPSWYVQRQETETMGLHGLTVLELSERNPAYAAYLRQRRNDSERVQIDLQRAADLSRDPVEFRADIRRLYRTTDSPESAAHTLASRAASLTPEAQRAYHAYQQRQDAIDALVDRRLRELLARRRPASPSGG